MGRRKKNERCLTEPAIYLQTEKRNGITKITTDQGILYIPLVSNLYRDRLKSKGWHMLDEEYYACDKSEYFEVVIKHLDYTVRVHRGCSVTNKEDDWWAETCGSLIPPFSYPLKNHSCVLGTGVVAWREMSKEEAMRDYENYLAELKSGETKEPNISRSWSWDQTIFN